MSSNFDKKKYDIDYKRKNIKYFKVDLKIEEYEELCKLLKEKELTKVQFVRNAFEELKKKQFFFNLLLTMRTLCDNLLSKRGGYNDFEYLLLLSYILYFNWVMFMII